MFETKEQEEVCNVRVLCLGRTADEWKKLPQGAESLLFVGDPMDASTWKEAVAVCFVIADGKEEGVVKEVKSVIEKLKVEKVLVIPSLITSEAVELGVPTFFINLDKYSEKKEIYEIIYNAAESVKSIVSEPGVVDLDLKDLRDVCQCGERLIMTRAEVEGENAARQACIKAMEKVTAELEELGPKKVVLLNVVGSEENLSMMEVCEASEALTDKLGDEKCNIIWGAAVDNELGKRVAVSIIIAG